MKTLLEISKVKNKAGILITIFAVPKREEAATFG